jgi:amino acid transporter
MTSKAKKVDRGSSPGGKLGTFAGVFTPSVLTILGIILFLRLGYVVGSAGLGRALVIIALANTISVLTSVSLSAVATNLRVKGGGDYYLISRTLGVEFGGSIGLVLFLAQAVSIAFYCIGFAEAVTAFFPAAHPLTARLVAAAAVSSLFVLAWLGADWATKFQYVVMTLLVAALISFFVGGVQRWDSALLASNWTAPALAVPFWALFAIFFPAVTGFTQGVSMSGDLADPGKSIPMGTFLAVGISILVYFAVALVFTASLPNSTLAGNYSAMKVVAHYGFLIDAGVVAATLSSAMASFLGAPRILQSLAADRVFALLTPFAKGFGPSANPRRGVLLSAAIAYASIALGQLNLIAHVVSMFFLISYGLLNYATYYEARAASPSFRPRFKWFHPYLSLLGSLTCLGAMLAIDPKSGAVAVAVLIAIHQYLKRTAGPARWADSARSYHLQQVRQHLIAADQDPEHARDWRPRMLVLTYDAKRREPLIHLAAWLEGGSGFAEAVQIVKGADIVARRHALTAHEALTASLDKHSQAIFPLTVCAADADEAIGVLIQSSGIGPLQPNTVLLNWFGESGKALSGIGAHHYVGHLKTIFRLGRNLVILHCDSESWQRLQAMPPDSRFIDVWWQNDATSHLMLLFAYLMTRHPFWQRARIRVLTAGTGNQVASQMQRLDKTLEDVRIEAEPQIVESLASEVIVRESSSAALVFLPIRFKKHQLVDPNGQSFKRTLPRLCLSVLMLAAEDIDLDAAPEEGLAGELAAAQDAWQEAEKKAQLAERRASETRKHAEMLKAELYSLEEKGKGGTIQLDQHEALKKEVQDADDRAEKTFRRAAKARTKANRAAEEAANLDNEPPTPKAPTDHDA